jgi:hypothetical protein
MQRIGSTTSRTAAVIALLSLLALVGVVALPVLAADPSASPGASAAPSPHATKPGSSGERAKPDKVDKANRPPEVEVTLTGTIATRTTAAGESEYTLTSGSTTVTLDAGPPWFFKDAYPLKPYVGKRVTVVGSQRAGSTEVDVRSVDGKELRAPGKPPWAGGWKQVGKDHPGWTQEKWDRWQSKMADKAKRHGVDCWPPGRCKQPGTPAAPSASGAPSS